MLVASLFGLDFYESEGLSKSSQKKREHPLTLKDQRRRVTFRHEADFHVFCVKI